MEKCQFAFAQIKFTIFLFHGLLINPRTVRDVDLNNRVYSVLFLLFLTLNSQVFHVAFSLEANPYFSI